MKKPTIDSVLPGSSVIIYSCASPVFESALEQTNRKRLYQLNLSAVLVSWFPFALTFMVFPTI